MQNKILEKIPEAKRTELIEQRRLRLLLAFGVRFKSPHFRFPHTLLFKNAPELIQFVGASVHSHREKAQTSPSRGAAYPEIMASGRIHESLEVYLFGLWLLTHGSPGLKSAPGRSADPNIVF